MSNTQPEALLLADILGMVDSLTPLPKRAADELRRLHQENEYLKMTQYGSMQLDRLRAVNRELLAALKECVDELKEDDPLFTGRRLVIDKASAAIAKAEAA